MTIYRSCIPNVPISDESLFTFLFEGKIDEEIPGTTPIFIDAPTKYCFTRSEFKAACLSLGWGLRNVFANELGGVKITRGDTVMILSPNSFAWPLTLFGSIAAGFKTMFTDPSYTPEELTLRWKDSRAKVVFTSSTLIPVVVKMLGNSGVSTEEARKRIIVMGMGDGDATANGFIHMDRLRGGGFQATAERYDGPLSSEAVYICYSSGTTGKPKGTELTHRNLIAECLMLQRVFPLNQVGVDVLLGIIPLYRIYGATVLLPFPISIGLPVVIVPQPGLEAFFQNIAKYKATMSLVSPTMCREIVHHPAMKKYNLKTLRALVSAGSLLSAPLIKDIKHKLKNVGADTIILQGYGMTELSPASHMMPHDQALLKAGSVGVLLPNLEARLVGDDGVDVEQGGCGELWLRGPIVMKGYLNDPATTRATITADGWCRTGDTFIRDTEGFYYFKDRIKDLIKYKDCQVSPAELEDLLLQHPKIADAAVIGVHSEKEATELPRAYVVPADKPQPGTESIKFSKEIQQWVQGQVSKHNFLRGGVVIIDEIPKNAAGKILRRQLRDLARDLSGVTPNPGTNP